MTILVLCAGGSAFAQQGLPPPPSFGSPSSPPPSAQCFRDADCGQGQGQVCIEGRCYLAPDSTPAQPALPPPPGAQPPAPSAPAPSWAQPPPPAPTDAPPSAPPMAAQAPADPLAASGRFGVGWYGVHPVPVGTGAVGLAAEKAATLIVDREDFLTNVHTPMLGARYWTPLRFAFVRQIAFEGSVGFSYAGGTAVDRNADAGETTSNGVSVSALAFNVGAPMLLQQGEQHALFAGPDVLAGFAWGEGRSDDQRTVVPAVSGSRLDFGLRAGIEVFMGRLGVPNLSVEVSARAGVALIDGAAALQGAPGTPPLRHRVNRVAFSTSLNDGALGALSSSIYIRYYL